MVNLCETILASAIGENCASPLVQGVESIGYIVNRSDVDWSSSSVTANKATIVLKSGKSALKIYQPKNTPFTGTTTEAELGTYTNTFKNTVAFVYISNGATTAKTVDEMTNGEFIVILVNKDKTEDATYQVYGYYQGLKLATATQEKYNDDTIGGWAITMEETKCPTSGLFMTSSAFNSLVTE